MAASTSYFHYDRQGNVDSVTDESGAIQNKYRYTAFGETTSTVQKNVENNFKYGGEVGYYLGQHDRRKLRPCEDVFADASKVVECGPNRVCGRLQSFCVRRWKSDQCGGSLWHGH